ncbi:MAG: glycosyltransferase [Pseudomonadota bacterium]
MSPKVTILIPNYQTFALTKSCLELIRQKTPENLYKVIVIDNDSQDESLAYLRTLPWITLLERKTIPGEKSDQAQARAFDLGLQNVNTPYVLTLHANSRVLQEDWLNYLIENIEANPMIAGVGAANIGRRSIWSRLIALFNKASTEEADHVHHHLDTSCAMYRVDLLRKYGLHFFMEWKTAGKAMHQNLIDLGFDVIALPPLILNKKIVQTL